MTAPSAGTAFVDVRPEISKGFGASLAGKLGPLGKVGGAAFLTTFTAAIAGAGAAVAAAIGQEAGVDKVSAQLGLSPEQQETVGDVAGKAYMNAFGDSVEANAGVVTSVMQRFGEDLPEEVLGDLTEGALTLSDVFDSDVNEVLNASQQLFTEGLAPSAEEAMDIVGAALRDTKGPRDELLSAINEYSPAFSALGLTGVDALGAFTSEAATSQFQIDKAGDAVKEFGIRVLDGSDTSKDALAEIGFSMNDVESAMAEGGPAAQNMTKDIISAITGIEDPAKRAQVGVALMGTPFEDLADNAVPILNDLVAGGEEFAGATQKIGDQAYDNIQTRLAGAWRTVKQTVIENVGGAIMPMFERLSQWLVDVLPVAIQWTTDAFAALSAWWTENGPAIMATASAVFEGVKAAIETVVAVIQTVIGWFQRGEAQSTGAMAGIQAFAAETWPKIQKIIQGVMEVIRTVIKTVTDIIGAIWSQHGDRIMRIAGAVWNQIKNVINTVLGVIQGIIDTVMGVLTGDWDRAWEGIKGIVTSIWDGIQGTIRNALDVLKDIIPIALDFIQEVWERVWDTVVGFLGEIWDDVVDEVSDGIDDVKEFFTDLPGDILDWLGDTGTLLVDVGSDLIEGLWDGIVSMGGWLADKISGWVRENIPGPIAKFLGISSPSTVAMELGRSFAEGIPIGMEKESRSVARASTELARTMIPGPVVPSVGMTSGSGAAAGGFHVDQIHFNGTPEHMIDALARRQDRELRLQT